MRNPRGDSAQIGKFQVEIHLHARRQKWLKGESIPRGDLLERLRYRAQMGAQLDVLELKIEMQFAVLVLAERGVAERDQIGSRKSDDPIAADGALKSLLDVRVEPDLRIRLRIESRIRDPDREASIPQSRGIVRQAQILDL